jgi:hypothetical protein
MLSIPKRTRTSATATGLRGRASANKFEISFKGTGSGGGKRKHETSNKNLIITIARNKSKTGWALHRRCLQARPPQNAFMSAGCQWARPSYHLAQALQRVRTTSRQAVSTVHRERVDQGWHDASQCPARSLNSR